MPIPATNPNNIYLPQALRELNFQNGTATLAAGSATITGVTLTANSSITATIRDLTGTGFLKVPVASRNTSTGQFVVSSTVGTDTSTFDWIIIG